MRGGRRRRVGSGGHVGDVDELDVGFLGQPPQQVECGECVDGEPFHQDPLGLTDEVPAGQGAAELLRAAHRVPRHRGVGGEDQAELDRLLVELVGTFGIKVERGQALPVAEQPERQNRPDRRQRQRGIPVTGASVFRC